MRYTEMAERSRAHSHGHAPHMDAPLPSYHRQPFHHPRTSLGAAGHLLHVGMVAAPLAIGEFIHDSEKRWRAMRMVPVLGAIASEALWALKIAHDRQREREDHAALDASREQCR